VVAEGNWRSSFARGGTFYHRHGDSKSPSGGGAGPPLALKFPGADRRALRRKCSKQFAKPRRKSSAQGNTSAITTLYPPHLQTFAGTEQINFTRLDAVAGADTASKYSPFSGIVQ